MCDYVGYNVEAVSFRKKRSKEKGIVENDNPGSLCECRVVNTLAFPRVKLLAPRILPCVLFTALALIK